MRPIRTKKDHKAALKRLEELWPEGQKFDSQADADEFEVLTILIEAYEAKTYPIEPPSPLAAIRFEMESRGLNNTQLAEKMGVSTARAGEVLAGKRSLSISMIRHLVVNLEMDAAVLLGAHHSDAA
jgi:HTH-type transcriptional regulator / antitoxin HigA